MKRRNEGSIIERNGNTLVRLYVGRDAAGRKVEWHHTVQGTDARAKTRAGRLLKDLVRRKAATGGQVVQQSRQSLGEWSTEFLEVWCGSLAARTRDDLRHGLTHYVPRDLQAVPLRALTPAHLQAWINGMTARGLAPRTVGKALAEVHRCLQVAVEHGRVTTNVAAQVTPPKRAHVERTRFTSEQAAAFLKAAESDNLYAFFVLALTTGARPAELLALRWSDVESDEIVIRRSLSAGVLADTKTGDERRMALGGLERAALARHKLGLGRVPQADGFIFAGPSGRPRDAAAIDHRHFKPLLDRAGLPSMRLYDLRHSCGSLLADMGTDPKVIQKRMGHADIATTYNNYIHAHPEAQARATESLNRALTGAAS